MRDSLLTYLLGALAILAYYALFIPLYFLLKFLDGG